MECMLFSPHSSDLTRQEIDGLWGQGVDLDDWDFILVVPADQVDEFDSTKDVYSMEKGWHKVPFKEIQPKDYMLQQFEVGCCANQWYRVNFRGKQVAMLVAYHS